MNEKLKMIIEHYGIESQVRQTMKECAELIQALNEYLRVKGDLPEYKAVLDIAEEIADVQIMLEQMKIYFGIEKMTAEIIEKKINRTLERMKKESETIAEKIGGYYE